MRIIGGRLKGLRFAGPLTDATRPTPERAREGIASALETRGAFEGALVLDLFAGTGALSFEALSRGAKCALLVDKEIKVLKRAIHSAGKLKVQDRIKLLSIDLLQNPNSSATRITSIDGKPFDLVFADPPYRDSDKLKPLLKELTVRGSLSPDCLLVIEHATGHPPDGLEELGRVDSYRYGDTSIAVVRLSRFSKR